MALLLENDSLDYEVPWKKHPARAVLYNDLLNGFIPLSSDDMTAREVFDRYCHSDAFRGMSYDTRFTRRLRDLRSSIKKSRNKATDARDITAMAPEKDKSSKCEIPWDVDHPVRSFLVDELSSGAIPLSSEDMTAMEVFNRYSQTDTFKDVGMEYDEKFVRRLRSLRNAIKRDKNRAADDNFALQIAQRNHPVPATNHRGEPQWNGSDAQKLLLEDMENGLHLRMRPGELYATRAEYQQFRPETIRWKIDQNIRNGKFHHTLKHRAELKLKKKQAKRDKTKGRSKATTE